MSPTRVGIAGFGRMGMRHVHAWRKVPGVQVIGVADHGSATMARAAAEGLIYFTNLGEFGAAVDIAVVSTPSSLHVETALPLLQAGVACLVEKPVALSHGDAHALVAAADLHQTLLAVGHSERFNPGVVQARALLRSAGAGVVVEAIRTTPWNSARPPSSNVVYDVMIHDLDWICWAFRELPVEVEIENANVIDGSLREVVCLLRFAAGQYVRLTASHVAQVRQREAFLRTTRGDRRISLEPSIPVGQPDQLTRQAHAFVDAFNGAASDLALGDHARDVLAIAELIDRRCAASCGVA